MEVVATDVTTTAGAAAASAAPATSTAPPLLLALPPPPSIAVDEIPGTATAASITTPKANVPAQTITVEPPQSLPQRLRANFHDTFEQKYQTLVRTILLEQRGDGGLSTAKRLREDCATETMVATVGTDSNHESQMGDSSCLDHDKAKTMRQSLYPSLYATVRDSGDTVADMDIELQRYAVELPPAAATIAVTANASVTDDAPASDVVSASSAVETASKVSDEALPLSSKAIASATSDVDAAATTTPSMPLVALLAVESDEKNKDLAVSASTELAPTTSTVESGAATVVAPLAPPPPLLPPPPTPKQRYTDIWGNVPAKEPSYWIECTVCKNNTKVNALRFASHLDKCMGIRTMSRSASAATNNAASFSTANASDAATTTGGAM
jgi:Sgf11 (transcriptional regulation protein)